MPSYILEIPDASLAIASGISIGLPANRRYLFVRPLDFYGSPVKAVHVRTLHPARHDPTLEPIERGNGRTNSPAKPAYLAFGRILLASSISSFELQL